MICPECGRHAFCLSPSTWVVCVATGDEGGRTVHEAWSFGRGSPMTEAQAEVYARSWVAGELRHRYPAGSALAVWRQGPVPQMEAS